MKPIYIVITLTLLFSSTVKAEYESALSVVESGLNAYKTKGARAAITTWIKGSGVEGSQQALSQTSSLQAIEVYFGKYQSYDIISENKMTKNIHSFLFVLNYEKGPLYAKMQTYKMTNGNWVASTFSFNSTPKDFFPDYIIYGK